MEQEEKEKLAEVLMQGYQDEMAAAKQYLEFAQKTPQISAKISFLNYVIEEVNHAAKLLQFIEKYHVKLQEEEFAKEEMIAEMIEYIAHEESALFYYDVLEKLSVDEEIVRLCNAVKKEESRHFLTIKELLKQVQAGERHE